MERRSRRPGRKNPYDDLSAGWSDWNDFFKNDTAGEAISKKDLKGNNRPTPDTADVQWIVGASQTGGGEEEEETTTQPVVFVVT